MEAVVLVALLQSLCLVLGQSGEEASRCDRLSLSEGTCAKCLEIPGCAWCSDHKYQGLRCNTPSNLKNGGCPSNHTVNPKGDVQEVPLSGGQLNLQKVVLTARVGTPVTFNLNITPAENYPVDFYYLMDLSRSMQDDLSNVKILASNISAKLNELTSKHRLAFGSFVDKEVDPFLKYEQIGKPFLRDGDIPYDYKHVLTFTESIEEFQAKIDKVISSGNRDVPEGTFDALMQVASCIQKLGWGDYKSTRRIVLIATDATFHMAGEGRFGGVVKPNDGKCYLTEKDGALIYSRSLEMDYPTVSQVFNKLSANHIQPIFAVTSQTGDVGGSYKPLVEKYKTATGATFGVLDSKSSNIIDLIERSYNEIVSTVRLTSQHGDNVNVDIKPKCNDPIEGETGCNSVGLGKTVTFGVSITATSCAKNSTSFNIVSPSFGTLEVELNVICRCDCESKTESNHDACSGNGTLVCGRCKCNSGRSGRTCQCEDASGVTNREDANCKRPNSTGNLICDGNGVCDCGVCVCNEIGDTGQKYYGQYCQCDDLNCEQYNNLPCGGKSRGRCDCGTCICNRGFVKSNCGGIDCSLVAPKCLTTVNGEKVNCSGHGRCDCGVCRCDDFYQGVKCDSCPGCAGRCDDFKQCVLCKVFRENPENETLCNNCPKIQIFESLQALKDSNIRELCEFKDDDGCTYSYSYNGTTDDDSGNTTSIIYAVEEKVCPEGPDVLLIVLAVIGGIVGIGIILLILWKLLTAMVDRREYQRFEKDRAKSKWHREKNPLYQPATTTVQNPAFVGKKE